MIDLRAGLGAPPIAFPGVKMQFHPELPSGLPGNAPLMPQGQTAQRALGCLGCGPQASPVALAGLGVGSLGVSALQVRWESIPTWAKIAGGAVLFSGVAYGVYRIVR